MIYDKLPVALLSALSTGRANTANAAIAQYLVSHLDTVGDISVKGLASACNVGTGSVSRFCRDVGFQDFDELRSSLAAARRTFEVASDQGDPAARAREHATAVAGAVTQAAMTVDQRLLSALVSDLRSYDKVFACGMLKAQAAAIDLQVDLLMLGKYVDTCVSYADQVRHIAQARADELVVAFSYTGTYFAETDLSKDLARIDRPRIWVVAGSRAPQPDYVYGCLPFESDLGQLGHPHQLEIVEGLIAQEFARTA